MHIHLAPQSIEALAMVISGGGGNDTTPPIGIYRSASKLESFMRGCNVAMSVGSGSRMPALIEALERANRSDDQTVLRNIIERAADPRDFLSDPDKLQAVIDYLNARLSYDGLELQRAGAGVRLGTPGRSSSVVDALASAVVVIDLDTVNRDLERALASAENDPEDAVTSACSAVESVCRSVLIELGLPLPPKKDIQGLYQAVREPLGLTPDKAGVADDIANDVRTILGGLKRCRSSPDARRRRARPRARISQDRSAYRAPGHPFREHRFAFPGGELAEEVSLQADQITLRDGKAAIMGPEAVPNVANVAVAPAATAEPLCWICKKNKADSGEHKTKRSDLLAVLGKPTQEEPYFYHDMHKASRPVGSLDAKILKSPVRICAHCNNTRTQPHDRAWETMSDRLRSRRLAIGQWVRCNRIFGYSTKRQMLNVHLFFLKLFGCMIAEAKANGHDVPIDLNPFSSAIMSCRPHAEVHLQFGRHDGIIGRSDRHCWTTDPGRRLLAAWLYELDTIAVSVIYAQAGRFEHRRDLWHPHSRTSSKRFQIADFMYSKRADAEEAGSAVLQKADADASTL